MHACTRFALAREGSAQRDHLGHRVFNKASAGSAPWVSGAPVPLSEARPAAWAVQNRLVQPNWAQRSPFSGDGPEAGLPQPSQWPTGACPRPLATFSPQPKQYEPPAGKRSSRSRARRAAACALRPTPLHHGMCAVAVYWRFGENVSHWVRHRVTHGNPGAMDPHRVGRADD